MRIFRKAMITTLAAAALLAAATPTFAQTQPKQQGLGVFVQGGYIQSSTYAENGVPTSEVSPKGGIIGVGFGGNKSGWFGVGVDLNYMFTSASDVTVLNIGEAIAENGTLKSQTLDIPVYGRINFGGQSTKNAPTFYVPIGWFFDIRLNADIDGTDVMDAFNGFSTGPMVGAGFEVYRIGVEARGMWAIKELQSTGGGTFLNGVQDSKAFTFVLLFKVRLH